MSSTTWNGATGNWNDSAAWSDGLPAAGITAVINTGTGFTLSVTDDEAAAAIYGDVSTATLAVTAGVLETGAFSWSGAFAQTGGVFFAAGVNPSWSGPASLSAGVLGTASEDGYSAIFYEGLTQTGGTLEITAGTLALAQTSLLDGDITGPGVLAIGSGATVTLGLAVTLASNVNLEQGGTLALAAAAGAAQDDVFEGEIFDAAYATLASNGQILTLGSASSGAFGADFAGGGTLDVQGQYNLSGLSITGSGGELTVAGDAILSQQDIYLGVAPADNETLLVQAGAELALVAPTGIDGNTASTLDIAGTLAEITPAAAGTSFLEVETLSLSGALIIDGILELEGPYSASPKAVALLGGSLGGGGTLEIGPYLTAAIGGAALDVAALQVQAGELLLTADQDYEGTLLAGNGTIDTAGFVLTLGPESQGALGGNVVDGGGAVVLGGTLEVNGPELAGTGTELLITGQAEEGAGGANDLYLGTGSGNTTTLAIASTGLFDISAGFGLYGEGTAIADNAGLLEQTGAAPYSGASFVDVTFDNTGTLDLQIGVLTLEGGVATFGGTGTVQGEDAPVFNPQTQVLQMPNGLVEGAGTLYFDDENVLIQASQGFQPAAWQWQASHITLAADLDYLGVLEAVGSSEQNTTINLQGHVLTVNAGDIAGIFTGGGTVVIAGTLDSGAPGNALELTGTGTTLLDDNSFIMDGGGVILGFAATDSTTLIIGSGASFDILGPNVVLYANPGTNGVAINQGLFEDNAVYPAGAANTNVLGTFINEGTVADNRGVLQFTTNFDNDGVVTVSELLEIDGTVSADPGDAGSFVIGTNATLAFTGAFLTNPASTGPVAASQTINFAGTSGRLDIQELTSFGATLDGFAPGDLINVDDQANAFAYGDGQLTLLSVFETSSNPIAFETLALGTLALPGINPADLLLYMDQTQGGIDIGLDTVGLPDAPFFDGVVYSSTWVGPSGDDFNTAQDWQTDYINATAATNPQLEAAVPFSGYDLIFPSAASSNVTVFDETFAGYGLSGARGTTFDITGGTLQLSYQLGELGEIVITGGTLESIDTAYGGSNGYDGFIASLALGPLGVLQIDNGGIAISGNGSSFYDTTNTIAGTIDGPGLLALLGGTYAIEAGAVLAMGTLLAAANAFILEADQDFQGQFFINTGTLDLNGNTLLLESGSTSSLAGTVLGGGVLQVAGYGAIAGSFTGASTELLITGTAQDADGGFTLENSASAVVAQDATLYNPYILGTTGTVLNDGLIDSTGLNQINYIEVAQFTNASSFALQDTQGFIGGATLEVDLGTTVLFDGAAMLGGTLDGNGRLELSGEIATLAGNVSLAVANLYFYASTISLQGNLGYAGNFTEAYGTLNSNGYDFTLDGTGAAPQNVLGGDFAGGGQLLLQGSYAISGFELSGTGTEAVLSGYAALGSGGIENGLANGDSTTFAVASGGVLNIIAASYEPAYGMPVFLNAGLVEDTTTAQDALQAATFVNTGTLDISYGELEINAASGSLGGEISGGGTLYLDTAGTLAFAPEASLGIANLFLQDGVFALGASTTYAGDFSEFNPTLDTDGFGLDLTGSGLIAGYISGGGAVTIAGGLTAGATEIWSPATTLEVTGTLTALGQIYAGSNTTGTGAIIDIAGTGTLDIATDGFLGGLGAYDNFTLDNAGLLEKTGATGITSLVATAFINTGTLSALTGTLDITGGLVNDGVIYEDALGALQIGGALSGTGVIIIDPSTTTISSAVGDGQNISFAGAGGTLVLDDAAQFSGTITGFAAGDVIDLATLAPANVTGEAYADGTLTISEVTGSLGLAFADPSAFPGFSLTSDGGTGTDVTAQAICYLRGTRILTASGEKPVEALHIGELVVTKFGGVQAIKWIGRQDFEARFIRANRAKIPVRIAAGALGRGLPARDLCVSPGHALLLHGRLILARNLVNGVTITQDSPSGTISYVQLEFPAHDCVRAEGVWAESFADGPGLRAQFHNAADFWALYPQAVPPETLRLCAARPQSGLALARALRPVVARARAKIRPGPLEGFMDQIRPDGITGWAIDSHHPELPVLLEFWLEGKKIGRVLACDPRQDLQDAGKGNGQCAFFYRPRPKIEARRLAELQIRCAATGAPIRATEDCKARLRV